MSENITVFSPIIINYPGGLAMPPVMVYAMLFLLVLGGTILAVGIILKVRKKYVIKR